jgi:DNA-binding helix-hairpin-helix protein with protein kinase domain
MLRDSMDLLNSQGHERARAILKSFDNHLQRCSVCANYDQGASPFSKELKTHVEVPAA